MNGADFALPIRNAPALGARPGSADELAALGLDTGRSRLSATNMQAKEKSEA